MAATVSRHLFPPWGASIFTNRLKGIVVRRWVTLTIWIPAALLAWLWRGELILLVAACDGASLSLRIFAFGSFYIILGGLAVPGAVLLTVLAGPLFGTAGGTLIASVASTVAASIAFLGSRHASRRVFESCDGAGSSAPWWSGSDLGAWDLLLLRLLPLAPYFAVNLYAGRSHLSLPRFFFVSQIGMLPATYLLVRLGTQLPGTSNVSRGEVITALWPLLLLGAGGWIARGCLLARRAPAKSTPPLLTAREKRSQVSSVSATSLLLCTIMSLGLTFGCARSRPKPLLQQIYTPVAQLPDYYRNPVIVIPGILGSRLVDADSGETVWGKFERPRLFSHNDTSLVRAALPMQPNVPLSHLRDSIQSDGTLAYLEVDVAGIPVEIEAYDHILGTLGVGGYRDPQHPGSDEVEYADDHFTCFQFDYDWRRDISENAVRLHAFIQRRREYIREQYQRRYGIENANVKFDIVAHSMGGLLARYYLRYGPRPLPEDGSLPSLNWAGARGIGRLVLVGPPNAGSALAVRDLVDGHRLAPFLPSYPPAVLGTMPAIYQLLPRPRHRALVDASAARRGLDVYDHRLWEQMRWGLADPDQDVMLQAMLPAVEDAAARRQVALDHQRKCLARARQLHMALDTPARPPPGVTLHLFAGDSVATPAVLSVDPGSGLLRTVSSAAGDDTVTRASAVMDERQGSNHPGRLRSPIQWSSTMFLHATHRGITSDPIFTDNVLSLLLESPQDLPGEPRGLPMPPLARQP